MKFKLPHVRIFVIIGSVFLVIGGLVWFRASRNNTLVNIKTVPVERGAVVENVTSSGKTKAKKQAVLHFMVAGRLSWIAVSEGDTVTAYQSLATLDKSELQKNLDKSLRDYSKERNDFEEDRQVTYADKIISGTLKRILEKNQWDLEKAVLDVELKDIALKWATLASPVSGIVIRLDMPVAGVNITATDSITVADPSSIVFSANIDETDIGKLMVGQNADVHLDAYPDKIFTGKVIKIAYSAESSSGGATVFPVDVSFADTSILKIGLNGDVIIKISEAQSALSIPIEAMREKGGEKFVVVKTKSGYSRQTVKTGLRSEDIVEITDGLSQDSVVVIEGFQFLPKDIQ